MKGKDTKIIILVLSAFVLLAVHVLQGENVASAIGGMIFEIAIGLVVGGLVLFNIFLFFFNIFRPDHELEFDIRDKLIAGIWVMIVLKIFGLF